uniref:Ovule protein n=1 Tax=Haemonchus contortus TaxID=6289 RepID=A0A7I4YHI9_HAECO
ESPRADRNHTPSENVTVEVDSQDEMLFVNRCDCCCLLEALTCNKKLVTRKESEGSSLKRKGRVKLRNR